LGQIRNEIKLWHKILTKNTLELNRLQMNQQRSTRYVDRPQNKIREQPQKQNNDTQKK
jgi:hypothetical protein